VFQSSLADGFPYTVLWVRRPVPGGTASGITSAESGSGVTAAKSGDCLVPFIFGTCLLGRKDADKLLGGLLMAGGAIVVLAGLAVCAISAGLKVKLPGPAGALSKGGGSGSGSPAPFVPSRTQIPLSAYPSDIPSQSKDPDIF
jgi:hypothetical protein